MDYLNFLHEVADSQANHPDGKIGIICAAMAPCMRLYAFLGQSLAASGFGRTDVGCVSETEVNRSLTSNPEAGYAEWVKTYDSADFESLASSLETLLDRYSSEEQIPLDQLASAYRRAMHLEQAFFSSQPGMDVTAAPALRPRLLAVDFDQTITEEDTSALIVEAGIDGEPDAAAAARLTVRRPSPKRVRHRPLATHVASRRRPTTGVPLRVRGRTPAFRPPIPNAHPQARAPDTSAPAPCSLPYFVPPGPASRRPFRCPTSPIPVPGPAPALITPTCARAMAMLSASLPALPPPVTPATLVPSRQLSAVHPLQERGPVPGSPPGARAGPGTPDTSPCAPAPACARPAAPADMEGHGPREAGGRRRVLPRALEAASAAVSPWLCFACLPCAP